MFISFIRRNNKLKNIHNVQHDGCTTCNNKLCAKKVSLFSNLSDVQIKDIIQLIERKPYSKHETVMSTGDNFDRMYIVNSGSLKATTYSKDGKEQILYMLNEGDSFGEMSLLKEIVSPYDLIALEESYICIIPKYKFDKFLRENPEIIFAIMESVHEKITSLEKLVGAISSNDADSRFNFLINRLMKQTGKKTSQGVLIGIRLTHEDMANFVGVTRETISRKLSYLSSEGKIQILKNRQIIIKDPRHFQSY